MPSAPRLPAARVEAERATARREYESNDQIEGFEITLAATLNFQPIQFSGRVDSVVIRSGAGQIRVRFRDLGEVAPQAFVQALQTTEDYKTACRIVEIQDPAGGGGGFISGYGRYSSRAIERRQSRRGPLSSDVRDRAQGAPEQLEPR